MSLAGPGPDNVAFGLEQWIADNARHFAPPVANREVFPGGDFIFMVIRGPNARSDFHIDPGDEIFHQLHGEIAVDLIVDGAVERHIVGAGDVLRVPAGVPHAPHRPADTWGFVIERPRADHERDQLLWFCETCGREVRRVEFHVSDIEAQLAEALGAWNSDETLRICPVGHSNPAPRPFTTSDLTGKPGPYLP